MCPLCKLLKFVGELKVQFRRGYKQKTNEIKKKRKYTKRVKKEVTNEGQVL
jgi:hypothetical protein